MKTPIQDLQVKVLMYHRIVDKNATNSANYYDVEVDNFRRQLQLLETLNYTTITFEDYDLYRKGILTLPKKPIILTFDDGHSDMVDTALPVLKEFNMKAVVFVLGDRSIRYADWDDENKESSIPLMTKDQILQLRKEGFEIGAHTMTHANLTELPFTRLKEEIAGSKKAIEELLGEEIISFAYPYGGVTKEAATVVEKSGLKYGCGVYTGPPRFDEDQYDIRRLAINYHVNTIKFLMRVATPYEYIEWMYGKLRNRNSVSVRTAQNKAAIRDYDFTTTNNF